MNADRPAIEARRVRQLFERTGPTSGQDDFVAREVAARMMERLDYIKLDPARALDAGCGEGNDLARLRQRFPQADWHALDVALPRLLASRAKARARLGFFERIGFRLKRAWGSASGRKIAAPGWICADFAQLPLATRSLDLIWSNLAVHWHDQPHEIFPEWARVLKPGGLVLFSAFGPDTLKEVTRAFAAIQASPTNQPALHRAVHPAVHPYTDMHDYGDMLVAAGFTTPVMDVERLTLTYSDQASLWRDVRMLGGNALAHRRRGLLGRQAHARLTAAMEAQRNADGQYALSFEIIYGHAWKGEPRTTADGQTIIRLDRGAGSARSRPGQPSSKALPKPRSA